MIGLLVVISRGWAVGWLPAVAGELTGEARLFPKIPNFVLPWKITLKPASSGGQAFALVIDEVGTNVRATGQIDPLTRDGKWKIEKAEIDAAAWFAACGPRFSADLAGMTARGAIIVTGEGILTHGRPEGRLKIEWREGGLRDEARGWALDRIGFQGEFAIDAGASTLHSTSPLVVTIGLVTSSRFGARAISLEALLTDPGVLSVTAARVEIAGGEVTADPFDLPLSPLALNAKLRITRVGLQDIVFLVPTAGLDDARGRIDGVVQVKWNTAGGFQLGLGHLALQPDEPTIVRLTAAPGILTGHVPRYIELLPSWMGPLARWVRPENPAYKNMRSIELGQSELRVKTLEVELTPDGDDRGRSATVRLVAQPTEAESAVKEVTFDVNVAGPIAAVVKLGLERGFTLDAH